MRAERRRWLVWCVGQRADGRGRLVPPPDRPASPHPHYPASLLPAVVAPPTPPRPRADGLFRLHLDVAARPHGAAVDAWQRAARQARQRSTHAAHRWPPPGSARRPAHWHITISQDDWRYYRTGI